MENSKSALFGRNVFADAFQEFDEQAFFENLHNRVKNKSYFDKYKSFKNTILAASYLFNVASMLSASYAVYWLTDWITGMAWAAYLIAGVFLFFLESLKRKSSTEFFQVYFFRKEIASGWLALSLFCFGISLASSAFGTKTGTENLSPDPDLIAADSTATAYRAEIAKLEAENGLLESQTDHTGTIYYRLQSAIKENKAMIADYSSRILELDKKLEGKNEQLSSEYQNQVETTAWVLVIITILMEILFEACIAYIWYFYYRSYVERKKTGGIPDNESSPPLPSRPPVQLPPSSEPLENPDNGDNGRSYPPVATIRRPVGFLTASQRAQAEYGQNTSVQTWTGLDRKNTILTDDRYTIAHMYRKGGKTVSVRYTLRMVNSRIAQYQREIKDCLRRRLGDEVLQNRQRWLTYWEGKRVELLEKAKDFV